MSEYVELQKLNYLIAKNMVKIVVFNISTKRVEAVINTSRQRGKLT